MNNFENAKEALMLSWETHRQAFGPILEPAFTENPQVRIPLTAALNHISRREVVRGMEILDQIKEFCIYDEDKAAWNFFVGLCYEMGGDKEQMLSWYIEAGKYGHRFYLPYLKLAKTAYGKKQYGKAKEYYTTGIDCLLEMPEDDREEIIIGSSYVNLISCLIMLNEYGTAEAMWKEAQNYPLQATAPTVAAILYAAIGDLEKMNIYLNEVKKSTPPLLDKIKEVTQQILNGTPPQDIE